MKHPITRRSMLKGSAVTAAALGLSKFTALSYGSIVGSNEAVRMGVIGFNGRGISHIGAWSNIKGVRLVALCDADSAVLEKTYAKAMKGDFINRKVSPTTHPTTAPSLGAEVKTEPAPKVGKIEKYGDLRKLLDNKDIDAVSTATPNHWHSLVTVWACQAGKDVYVEKPISHEIWEGRQSVLAARKYNRIVQAGTQSRSSQTLRKAIDWLHAGNLGKIQVAHGLCYKRRGSIGLVTEAELAKTVPATVDLDLWCGPSPKEIPHRKHLHYDWHWFWQTGNGDIGNQGIHQMDVARWALGKHELSSRILSVGGRFGYEDDGETPNTQFAIHDFGDQLLIFEVQGLPSKPGSPKMGNLKGQGIGHVVYCEGGYLAGTVAYDKDGKEVKDFSDKSVKVDKNGVPEEKFEGDHFANFIKGVRSRKIADLHADIEEGHLSSALCHTSNISYRLGHKADPNAIREAVKSDPQTLDTFERFKAHLAINEVDISMDKAVLGVPLKMDIKAERFVDNDEANQMLRRDYRAPFVVPEVG